MRGKLIVLEGLSGSGKGTQILKLAASLYRLNLDVLVTREPTLGPYGRAVRELRVEHKQLGIAPESQASEYLRLYTEDSRDHCTTVIHPALESGAVVLCDRYYHSRLAYQTLQGLDFDKVLASQREAGIIIPDLTIILDIEVEKALERIEQRGVGRSQLEQLEFMTKLRTRYLELPMLLPSENIHAVDSSQGVDTVAERILEVVAKVLRLDLT